METVALSGACCADNAQIRSVQMFEDLIAMLVDALCGRGLSAEPFGASMVFAVNRAADPPPGSARLSPGLRQVVQCRTDEMGDPGWYWVWNSPGQLPTYEWFAPAAEIEAAAAKIARVLAVRPETVS
jgi:hypothetical protein